MTVFINPFFGLLVDWFGRRTGQLLASICVLIGAHLLIYSAAFGPVLPLLMIGLSFSVFGSVIWPCIPLIVEEKHHATAYGIMAAFQNTAQCLVPLILQGIFRETDSYRSCEVFLALFASVGLIFAILLWYVDEYWEGAVLRKP